MAVQRPNDADATYRDRSWKPIPPSIRVLDHPDGIDVGSLRKGCSTSTRGRLVWTGDSASLGATTTILRTLHCARAFTMPTSWSLSPLPTDLDCNGSAHQGLDL